MIDWTLDPADQARFAGAVAHAQNHESAMDRDIGRALMDGAFNEPWPDCEVIGPVRMRGDPSGVIVQGGKLRARWGPVDTADMTFSVSKSFLSICAGLAWADGLIDLDRPCRETVGGLFDAPQNRAVTWRHLLTLTSEWEGALHGKADRIDRHRRLGAAPGTTPVKGSHRDLAAPGAFWEYNDVRVNVLALALMRVFRRPLPEILRARIMDPIDASQDWEWHGYATSWEEIDGRRIQSVSGGGHWGGGLMIPTLDLARVGVLMARRGRWGDAQLIPEDWIDMALAPCALNPGYGFLWWLNRAGEMAPSAAASAFFAIGVGRNAIWVDPDLDLVAVIRWIEGDAMDAFCAQILDAI